MNFMLLKSALRNVWKNKQNSIIIILSLTVSFALTNILITYISFETRTDHFHAKKDRIYRLFSDDPYEPGRTIRFMHGDMKEFILHNYEQVKDVCGIHILNRKGSRLSHGNVEIDSKLLMAVDSNFFSFFDFELAEGSKENVIRADGILLGQEVARSLMGDGPYVNETISIYKNKEWKPFTVTGILAPTTENSQLKFDAIVSREHIFGGSIYLSLEETMDPDQFAQMLSENTTTPSLVGPGKSEFELVPLTDSYFHSASAQPFERNGNKQLIIICWGVVALLCLTASFNFINLYIVGLLQRIKELNVKRILGAGKKHMLVGVATEVGIFVFISLALCLVLTVFLMPYFNTVLETDATISNFSLSRVIFYILGGTLIVAMSLTAYLSLFVWRFKPIAFITEKRTSKAKVNKFMFSFQFFISVGLVICSFVIINQINYIKDKPLGFNRKLMQLQVDDDKKQHLTVLKDKLLSHSQIDHAAVTLGNPIFGNAIIRVELEDGTFYQTYLIRGDEDLVSTMQWEIIDGSEIMSHDTEAKWVNESFVKYFDMKDPVGKPLPGLEGHIVGVIKDFNCRSLRQEIPPYVISSGSGFRHLIVDISNTTKQEAIAISKEAWLEVFPDEPFQYRFVEDELLAHHSKDISFLRIIISFTLASLLISCFGLFGIASFTIARRTHEIGIRKVLGASFGNIIMLIWKEYVKLIAISFILAVPIVNYFLQEWLQEFAFRIELHWWLYIIPGIFIVLIALLTISGQSLRAARLNPVESIKEE